MEVRSRLLKQGRSIPFKVFRNGGREHYNVKIYISAKPENMAEITKVEYELHPSFRNPRRVSTDQQDGFAISIWTWGLFEIGVTVHFEDGTTREMTHALDYSLPADTGDNYVLL